MSDEAIATALQEIAGYLRRRVEQHEEQARRTEEFHKHSEERFAKMKLTSDIADSFTMREESEKRLEEIRKQSEQRQQEAKLERERFQEEDRQFKEVDSKDSWKMHTLSQIGTDKPGNCHVNLHLGDKPVDLCLGYQPCHIIRHSIYVP